MSEIDIVLIKELIRLVFSTFNNLKNQSKLPKKTIQKILYRVKQQLPDDNPIKEQLAFYWFQAGPYSEIIDEGIRQMKNENHLIRIDNEFELYQLSLEMQNKRYISPHPPELQQAREIIQREVEPMLRFSNLFLVKEIYEDAPIQFYQDYKSRFLIHFESYCDHHNYESTVSENKNKEDLKQLLINAKNTLSTDVIFSKFNLIYSEFDSLITTILDSKINNQNDFLAIINNARYVSNEVWRVFAFGARILYHDKYYIPKLSLWKTKFEEQTHLLEKCVLDFKTAVKKLGIIIKQQNMNFDDLVIRMRLAKSIGLDEIPKKDPEAFDRLTGIIATKINRKNFDSVELIKEVRS